MKKFILKRVTILLTICFVIMAMVTSVYAYRWFTPTHGSASLINNSSGKMYKLAYNNFQWYSHTYTGDEAFEFEFRYSPGISKLVNQPRISGVSNLPGYYFEDDDPDDITFGSHNPHNINAASYYSGYMTFSPKSNQPSSFAMELETEYGLDFWTTNDPLPRDSESLGYLNKGSSKTW